MPKKSNARPPRAHLLPGQEPRPARRPARSGPAIPIGTVVPPVELPRPEPADAAPAPGPRPRSVVSPRPYRGPRSSNAPLITDYHYVLDDLRRIGLLAGVAFAALIGLTFVIH